MIFGKCLLSRNRAVSLIAIRTTLRQKRSGLSGWARAAFKCETLGARMTNRLKRSVGFCIDRELSMRGVQFRWLLQALKKYYASEL